MTNVDEKLPFWFSLEANISEKMVGEITENTAHLNVIYI